MHPAESCRRTADDTTPEHSKQQIQTKANTDTDADSNSDSDRQGEKTSTDTSPDTGACTRVQTIVSYRIVATEITSPFCVVVFLYFATLLRTPIMSAAFSTSHEDL